MSALVRYRFNPDCKAKYDQFKATEKAPLRHNRKWAQKPLDHNGYSTCSDYPIQLCAKHVEDSLRRFEGECLLIMKKTKANFGAFGYLRQHSDLCW